MVESSPTSRLNIVLLGTLDTKLEELLYLRSRILSKSSAKASTHVILIDVGRTPSCHDAVTVTQRDILSSLHRDHAELDLSSAPRNEVIHHLADAATAYIDSHLTSSAPHLPPPSSSCPPDTGLLQVHGIIAAGGSGNTALASQVMRSSAVTSPIGFPKLIVSTVAGATDTSHIVGATDIILTPSVVDVAGLNDILTAVLDNAAAAMVGMVSAYRSRSFELGQQRLVQQPQREKEVRLGITMFGVTTPCVDRVRALLATDPLPGLKITPYVFHATGAGGLAMESLIRQNRLDAVLDLTTTEIADHVVGGVMSAGPDRLDAALSAGLPCVLSVGACDMVNFGPVSSVPERFSAKSGRNLLEHNKSVTLMRTSPEECAEIGRFIVEKVKRFASHSENRKTVRVIAPQYISALSYPGQPFEDLEADQRLFDELAALNAVSESEASGRKIKEARVGFELIKGTGINDAVFAANIVQSLTDVLQSYNHQQESQARISMEKK